ncbi:MAG: PAS domain S-box protein [Candidatus Nomurabacteria bacterium]|jgi:PAS domain S-box-containing protein|nr:PAS domain S-box protein [Candidatus Nomurabacteria bacterium]
MKKGGDDFDPRALRLVKPLTLVMSCFIAAYDLAIHFGLAGGSGLYSNAVAYVTAAFFVAFSVGLYLFEVRRRRDLVGFALIFHILATFSVFFVTGDTTMSYLFWLLIMINTGAILGWRWLGGSIVWFLLTMAIFTVVQHSLDFQTAISVIAASLVTVTITLFLGWMRSRNLISFGQIQQAKLEQKALRERLLTLLNSLTDAVITLTNSHNVRLFNSATLNLLDTNRDLSGKNIDQILPLFDQDEKPVSLDSLMKQNPRPFERDDLNFKYSDGQVIRLHILCTPVRTALGEAKVPGVGGAIVMARDITKAKTLEEERDEFISVVSHELRTPVAIVEGTIGNLQFMMEKGGDPKTLAASLEDAHKQTLYLAGMVNDLSTLSRAERGVGMEREVIDAREFLDELYKKYAPDAKTHKLDFKLDADENLGQLNTSRMAVEEILQNIIENAFKYTKQGGVILSAKRIDNQTADGEKTIGQIEFAVRDSGIGISKSDQKNVFKRFWRSEDYRTRETGGTGLGLNIAGRLAGMIGSEIHLSSRLNHGSTFSFNLPVYNGNGNATEKSDPNAAPTTSNSKPAPSKIPPSPSVDKLRQK